MTDIVRAVILGIVEGLTEFLPVSSTGHMILVMPWIGLDAETDVFWNNVFNFFIQIGAILAVVIYFWRRLWRLTFHPPQARWRDHILLKLFVAMIPAGVLGVLFDDFMKEHLMTVPVVATALVLGGVAILLIEKFVRQGRYPDAGMIPLRVAFMIGVIQCLAMVPGTSRSGATIMGALLLGLSPVAAAEFSFFLAIPTLLGAGMLSLLKGDVQPEQTALLAIGFVTAFITAWVVVAAFMRFIQHHRFTAFAIYRIVIGVVILTCLLAAPKMVSG
ncbi:MAG: undecaprenyl-diphosphate phosphatase [Phycisphaerae bacterium]|nr:undecaprenyl-diphosphate phosphatase [Phycisphaerae bacterium]